MVSTVSRCINEPTGLKEMPPAICELFTSNCVSQSFKYDVEKQC